MRGAQNERLSIVESIKNDLLPSFVVFLVALPLCLGIAIASGAPPAAGLITGIIGGIIVGSIAGAPLQVSGPAAGLTVIVFDLFQRFEGETYLVFLVVAVAGLMQIAAGLLGLGQWFRAVSPAVIQGMLAGIGLLIIGSQFQIMADDAPRKGMELFGFHLHAGLANLLAIPETIGKVITNAIGTTNRTAFLLGLMTIAVILLWKKFASKALKLIPGPLLGVVIATVLTYAFGWNATLLADKIPDSIVEGLQLPVLSQWMSAPWQAVLVAAAGIALVASAETLLCATAVDQMHQGTRTKYNRELMAQGLGNTICGVLGGLPMTGVIVRSAANIEAGGKTRFSAIFHGIWMLAFIALVPGLLKIIPIASLAAVLVFTGIKLVNVAAVKKLAQFGLSEVAIYLATVATIVSTDLLMGVGVGIALAALKLFYRFSRLVIRESNGEMPNQKILAIDGSATFIVLPKLAAALDRVPGSSELHVRMDKLEYIDHACLDLLMNWEKQHESTGGSLVVDWDSLTAKFNGPNSPKVRTPRHRDPTRGDHGGSSHRGATPVSSHDRPIAVVPNSASFPDSTLSKS